jgi:hypothetical protein
LATNGALLAQQLVSVYGRAQIGGRDAVVHVWVVLPPGADANQVALEALRSQGARPFLPGEFSTTGLVWDQFFNSNGDNDSVVQHYNPAGEPTTAALTALTKTHTNWTSVASSRFAFSYGGTTDRCPSLVRECPGPQSYDGLNDVAWLPLSGCCTLGVTWYSTSVDEADMALNSKFPWATNGQDYDLESVYLHENGHVAGLGHSEVEQAVMYAYYSGLRLVLRQDDIDGLITLYPLNEEPPDGGACTLGQQGEFCSENSQCCSGKCTGKPNFKSCK